MHHLTKTTATQLHFEQRSGLRGYLLMVPPIACIAVIPLAAPGAADFTRWSVAVIGLSIASALAYWSRPRKLSYLIDLTRNQLQQRGRSESLDGARFIADSQAQSHAEVSRYRIDLRLSTGEQWTLLSAGDPAKVYSDYAEVAKRLPLPAEGGWSPGPSIDTLHQREIESRLRGQNAPAVPPLINRQESHQSSTTRPLIRLPTGLVLATFLIVGTLLKTLAESTVQGRTSMFSLTLCLVAAAYMLALALIHHRQMPRWAIRGRQLMLWPRGQAQGDPVYRVPLDDISCLVATGNESRVHHLLLLFAGQRVAMRCDSAQALLLQEAVLQQLQAQNATH